MSEEELKKISAWVVRDKYGGFLNGGLDEDLERVQNGEPIAYVIGWVSFLGAKIDLSFWPLIPREETEFWVGLAIEEMKKSGKENVPCLDLFAGSGAIGLAILKNVASARVDFGEIDQNLLKQIEKNLEINGIDLERAKVFQSDVFNGVKEKYDYIFANPPYIALSKKGGVQKSVLDYESHKALFGGDDGLEIIKRFLVEAKHHLNPDGVIYLEFDDWQKESLENDLKLLGYNFHFEKDQFEKWRWVRIGCG